MDDNNHAARPVIHTSFVFARFGLRLGILALFALASSQPFSAVLTTLLVLGSGLCMLIAVVRQEPAFGPTLTHWDEAVWYALLSRCTVLLTSAGIPG
jgi:hypothetical protein